MTPAEMIRDGVQKARECNRMFIRCRAFRLFPRANAYRAARVHIMQGVREIRAMMEGR